MRNVFLIAADNIRALLHRRLLLALMLVLLIVTVILSFSLTQTSKVMNQVSQSAPAVESADQEIIKDSPDAQAIREAMEQAQADMDEEQREDMRRSMQGVGTQLLSVFYGFTTFGGVLVALFIGATAVSTDVRSGAITMVLSKPVARWQFLLGKYSGAMAVLLAYSVLIGITMVIFTQMHQLDSVPAIRYAPWLLFCQCLIYGSLALVLSTIMHPAFAGVLAFFIQADWLTFFLRPENPFYYLTFLLPSYGPYDVSEQFAASGTLLGWGEVGILTVYALDLTVIYLLLAMWRFRSRAVV